jgi:hypothetical protein
LVSVRTFIQLLPERLDDEEFRTSFRNLALGEIDRICGLINDLLAFSRPGLAERESTDVAELACQITRLLDAEARKQDVRLACEAAAGTPRVWASEAQLKQVLMNVVLNGIQACPGAGHVRVSTRGERRNASHWCVIEVADTGPALATPMEVASSIPSSRPPLGSGPGSSTHAASSDHRTSTPPAVRGGCGEIRCQPKTAMMNGLTAGRCGPPPPKRAARYCPCRFRTRRGRRRFGVRRRRTAFRFTASHRLPACCRRPRLVNVSGAPRATSGCSLRAVSGTRVRRHDRVRAGRGGAVATTHRRGVLTSRRAGS